MYAHPKLEKANEFKVVKCPTIADFKRSMPNGFEAKGDFSGEEEVDLRGSTPLQMLTKLSEIGEEDLPE